MDEFLCLMVKMKFSQRNLRVNMHPLKDTTFWTEPQRFVSEEFVDGKAIMKLYYVDITWSQARFLIALPGSFFNHIKANLKSKS